MQSETGTSIVAKDDLPPSIKGRSAPDSRKTGARPKQPFDHWLHKQLHEMYDSIAKEPLPDDLLKLIDEDSGAGSTPAPGGDGIPKKE